MRTVMVTVAAVASVAIPTVAGAATIFKLNLSGLPYGQQSVSPDYSSGAQTMYLDQVWVANIPNLGKALRIIPNSSFVDFFVSQQTFASKTDPIVASWRGRFLGDAPVTISLGGGHFEGMAALRAEAGKLFLETDAGPKQIGTYKKGLNYIASLKVDFSAGFDAPTATIRYNEIEYGTGGKQLSNKAFGPISVTYKAKFDAAATNYFTLIVYGDKSPLELGGITITSGLPNLILKTIPKLPPQNLPKFPPKLLPFKH